MNMLVTKEEVKKILDDLSIKNYIINDDLTVDVNGHVNLRNKNLISIPVKFSKVKMASTVVITNLHH